MKIFKEIFGKPLKEIQKPQSDADSVRPLLEAVRSGEVSKVAELVAHDDDILKRKPGNWEALNLAAVLGHTEVIAFLLEKGRWEEAWMLEGALVQGVQSAHVEVVHVLVKRTGSPSNRVLIEACGGTWTHAEPHRRTQVVRLLLEAGADPNGSYEFINSGLCNPIEMAVESGHIEVVRLLLEAGAIPDWRGSPGRNLAVAKAKGFRDIVDLLEKAGARETRS